jgi:glyoxylase-like metal-dependent hydrolase (beta-lactamase superfamily II)
MPEEILPDVYDLTLTDGDGPRFRAYLVDADVPTLVDTGLPDTTDALLAELEAVGLDPGRVVVTHGDGDHVGGYDAVCDAYDAETWVPEPTDADLQSVDNRYGHGDTVGPFEAVHAPGHEQDLHALVDEDAGYLVASDAVYGGDLRGLPAGYLIAPPAVYSENVNRAEESMETLLGYEFDAVLVFHGTSVLEGGRDRLDSFVNFPAKPDDPTYVR